MFPDTLVMVLAANPNGNVTAPNAPRQAPPTLNVLPVAPDAGAEPLIAVVETVIAPLTPAATVTTLEMNTEAVAASRQMLAKSPTFTLLEGVLPSVGVKIEVPSQFPFAEVYVAVALVVVPEFTFVPAKLQ